MVFAWAEARIQIPLGGVIVQHRAHRQDVHGRFLELAMRSEATEEVQAARKHVERCSECNDRILRLTEVFEKAGVLPRGTTKNLRESAELR